MPPRSCGLNLPRTWNLPVTRRGAILLIHDFSDETNPSCSPSPAADAPPCLAHGAARLAVDGRAEWPMQEEQAVLLVPASRRNRRMRGTTPTICLRDRAAHLVEPFGTGGIRERRSQE